MQKEEGSITAGNPNFEADVIASWKARCKELEAEVQRLQELVVLLTENAGKVVEDLFEHD